MKERRKSLIAVALVSLLALSACGGPSDEAADATDAADASDITSQATPGQDDVQRGTSGGRWEEIEKCLNAAGLEGKLPKRPSDMPSVAPEDPSTARPDGPPAGAPEGSGMAVLQDEDVQVALKACGIEMPEGPQWQQPSD